MVHCTDTCFNVVLRVLVCPYHVRAPEVTLVLGVRTMTALSYSACQTRVKTMRGKFGSTISCNCFAGFTAW